MGTNELARQVLFLRGCHRVARFISFPFLHHAYTKYTPPHYDDYPKITMSLLKPFIKSSNFLFSRVSNRII